MKYLATLSLIIFGTPAFSVQLPTTLHTQNCPKSLTVNDIVSLYDKNENIKIAGVTFGLNRDESDSRPNIHLPLSRKIFEDSIKLNDAQLNTDKSVLTCTLNYSSKTRTGWKIILNGIIEKKGRVKPPLLPGTY